MMKKPININHELAEIFLNQTLFGKRTSAISFSGGGGGGVGGSSGLWREASPPKSR